MRRHSVWNAWRLSSGTRELRIHFLKRTFFVQLPSNDVIWWFVTFQGVRARRATTEAVERPDNRDCRETRAIAGWMDCLDCPAQKVKLACQVLTVYLACLGRRETEVSYSPFRPTACVNYIIIILIIIHSFILLLDTRQLTKEICSIVYKVQNTLVQ